MWSLIRKYLPPPWHGYKASQKPIPAIGETWKRLIYPDSRTPWTIPEVVQIEVVDLKDGWVQYKLVSFNWVRGRRLVGHIAERTLEEFFEMGYEKETS